MEYRQIGDSELKLSLITFGAWAAGGWMWGGTEHTEAEKAIRAAYDCGVSSIDTAPVYGMGVSEEIVGKAIAGIPRDKVQILTKCGLRWDLKKGVFYIPSSDNNGNPLDIYKYSGKESVIEECENSLRRLKTDYIDLYQVHWPDESTPIEETMEAFDRLIQSGKIRYAGVSNFSTEQLKQARQSVKVVSNQVSYSMINREIEQELAPHCLANNISILAYSPLGRGILTGKIKENHVFASGDHRANHPAYSKENIQHVNQFLEKLRPLCAEKNITLSQMVLRWTIEQPGITIALAGARNAEQSILNARAADVKLSSEELKFIKGLIQ